MSKEENKEKELDRMTVKELREIAAEISGLAGVHAMKKAELLVAIKEAKGIKDEKPPQQKREKIVVTVKELKAKIVELKGKRDEARKAKDKRLAHVLRRRLNRLRKETRKLSQA